MEKNMKKNTHMCVYIYVYVYMCIYMYMNHFAVHHKLTQHCKSTILQFKKKKQAEDLNRHFSKDDI